MPFVENNKYIDSLLRFLKRDRRREGVNKILLLSENWNTGLQDMNTLSPQYRLTSRQLEILRLSASGKSFKDIARFTGLAYGTIRNQFFAMYKRFGVHDAKGLLEVVERAGLPVSPLSDDTPKN
jgi:DNA-binding NarL/FixJ family response regulator